MFCLLYRAPIFSLLSDPILFASVGPIIIGEREREREERERRKRERRLKHSKQIPTNRSSLSHKPVSLLVHNRIRDTKEARRGMSLSTYITSYKVIDLALAVKHLHYKAKHLHYKDTLNNLQSKGGKGKALGNWHLEQQSN